MNRTILDKVFEATRTRVEAAKSSGSQSELRASALELRASRNSGALLGALSRGDSINIIAEFKRASPSRGPINHTAAAAEVAIAYENAGARAISVLTEPDFFKGSLSDLAAARNSTSLPILRKDFIFDVYQIWEAALAGADAVLLIAAMLDDKSIERLIGEASEFKLDVLVEVHTLEELLRAAAAGAGLVGVNNRNLRSFEVSLDTARELAAYAPSGALMIAESGLRTREELLELQSLGYQGFLIGETLMASADPESELRALLGENR